MLPNLANQRRFPVRFNHCFQRIILDNLFGRCWYEVLDRRQPAYKQLTEAQLEQAIQIAEQISDRADEYLWQLDRSSLQWRGKEKAVRSKTSRSAALPLAESTSQNHKQD